MSEAVMNKSVEDVIENWHEKPKESAKRLLDYYGEPDEYSENQIIWYNTNDGWKRTVLRNEEIPHEFPAHHVDYLEQFIDYRVPIEKHNELALFDGSITVERTKGEMSARCGGTSMNFVAINLAHDIITDNKTVEEARDEYTDLYKKFQEGEKDPYIEAFQFDLLREGTADPDVSTIEE